jgi:hypothetical protein
MNGSPILSTYEKAVLWHAIEGTYLIEIRDGADDLPSASIEEHRRKLGAALLRLVSDGYVRAYLAPWPPSATGSEQPLSAADFARRLTTEAAWDQQSESFIAFEATATGRQVQVGE